MEDSKIKIIKLREQYTSIKRDLGHVPFVYIGLESVHFACYG